MTEIEQLQLKYKCEQLELMATQLTYLHILNLSMYRGHKINLKEKCESKVGKAFKTFAQLEKLSKDDLQDLFVEFSESSLVFEKGLLIVDSYIDNINVPYKEIALKLTNERRHTHPLDDFKYAMEISGLKEEITGEHHDTTRKPTLNS